jgi:glycosyltransferase involved in cell wall biosynthesis
MKILQIGNTDKVGNRFNGHDLQKYYNSIGHEASHFVWIKDTQDINTYEISSGNKTLANIIITFLNYRLSIQSLLYFGGIRIFFKRKFWNADVIHLHLIHTGYFSLFFLPILSWIKPTVWTIHDPWAITGHCIYPMSCERWKIGCGNCPDLKSPMPIKHDTSRLMWFFKAVIYKISRFKVIVASNWMKDKIQTSPLLKSKNIFVVPFGIDQSVFKPQDNLLCKKEFGIDPDTFVICFRSNSGKFKGLEDIIYCLDNLVSKKRICLLTVNERGLVDKFIGKHQIVELGWVSEDYLSAKIFNACDIFLMPSRAEAFGMMAIEAMSCGKTVVAYNNTSLSEVLNTPHSGVCVEYGNKIELLGKVQYLIDNESELSRIGNQALTYARENYCFKKHQKTVLDIYKSLVYE